MRACHCVHVFVEYHMHVKPEIKPLHMSPYALLHNRLLYTNCGMAITGQGGFNCRKSPDILLLVYIVAFTT